MGESGAEGDWYGRDVREAFSTRSYIFASVFTGFFSIFPSFLLRIGGKEGDWMIEIERRWEVCGFCGLWFCTGPAAGTPRSPGIFRNFVPCKYDADLLVFTRSTLR